jgi:hypothetical protein
MLISIMKKTILFLLLTFSFSVFAQTDYSDSWEDFYSYNNVKDFIKVDNVIYALSDNAVFTYNTTSQEINKLSSIQGLSGETTSSIYYSAAFKRLVIGYQNGLIEVVDEDGEITISSDIVNFNQSGEKSINHISERNNKLYLSTPFAIVVYDIENLEFGDTFFIGNNSGDVKINETTVFNDIIYAATEDGIFFADVTNDLLIDFNLWQQNFAGTGFKGITIFDNKIYTNSNTELFLLDGVSLISQINFFQTINGLKSSNSNLTITLNKSARVFNSSMNQVLNIEPTSDFDFNLNTSFVIDNDVYLATKEFGVLSTSITNTLNFTEIHPVGPLSNEVFAIEVSNNNLWIVYGGYDNTYTPIQKRQGFSHFNGEEWINKAYNIDFPLSDLNYVSIDPNHENRVYISSFGDTGSVNTTITGGLLVVENDEIKTFYNHLNSPLEDIVSTNPGRVTIRISGTAFDSQGNLWVTNIGGNDELKKLSPNLQWSSVDLNAIKTDPALGLNEVALDRNNSVWIGTRRNGVYVYNENGNRKKALNTSTTSGALPDLNVRTVAIDNNNRVWLGTQSGLVVFSNASSIFDESTAAAAAVIILDDGVARKLLGDQTINAISIDGAENKWFGTDSGGVLYTNPNGQTTLANFNKDNSPIPSNRILKIKVDKESGKVYFATDKGIVAYNSNVAPFGDVLGAVYAYPNPALKNHEIITIDGRNGTHLPKGTNVKILDVAGNLVFETNVVEGEQLQGGKVVWNKKNLAGTKVASGIYIVLLSNSDASETSITKIAIVN